MTSPAKAEATRFDLARSAMLSAFNAFLRSPNISGDVKRQEAVATQNALAQLMTLAETPHA